MNTTAQTLRRSAVLSYFSLFTSLSTLLCCALPSLLVLFGLGASVASTLSFLPWLVALSRHKQWTFLISGTLIILSIVNTHYFVPRFRAQECGADDPSACADATKLSNIVLWASVGIYLVGFLVAYGLGPMLARMDGVR